MAATTKGTTRKFLRMHLHEGHYLDPVLRDIEAFMESSQKWSQEPFLSRFTPIDLHWMVSNQLTI